MRMTLDLQAMAKLTSYLLWSAIFSANSSSALLMGATFGGIATALSLLIHHAPHLGFGRIVALDIKAPNRLAKIVQSDNATKP